MIEVSIVVRKIVLAIFVFAVAAVPGYAGEQSPFPQLRIGRSLLTTSGGGVIAGKKFITRSAVIAWNRRWNSLTLYMLPSKGVTCATLRRATTKPGHRIQIYVTGKPQVHVSRPMANPQVAFVTTYRGPNVPEHVAGLRHGAQLTFASIDSFPGGTWRGVFKVPLRIYGDGKLYGYKGTFAAKWCELRH